MSLKLSNPTFGVGKVLVEDVEVLSLSSNNLGVGTSDPIYKGDFNVSTTLSSDVTVAFRIKATTTSDMADGFGVTQLFSVQDNAGVNRNIAQIRAIRSVADDSGALIFAPYSDGGAIERLRITRAGSVGIGVADPSYKLHVVDPLSSSIVAEQFSVTPADMQIAAASTGVGIVGTIGNYPMVMRTVSVERVRINTSGKVLVNTATDFGARLTSSGTTVACFGAPHNDTGTLFESYNTIAANVLQFNIRHQGVSVIVGNARAGNLSFETNSSERARITSGGYFKASNTGSYGGVAGLGDLSAVASHVFQENQNNACLAAINSNTGASAVGVNSYLVTGAAGFHFRGSLNAVNVYQVLANGNVQNTNNSYGAISDIKLKENIVDTSPKLDELTQVRIVNYTLKSDPDLKQIGVIAQELEEIFPGLVDSTPDLDEEGNDLGTVTKSVKYSVFVPILIKALQEETAARKSLEDRIAAIEAKLGQ